MKDRFSSIGGVLGERGQTRAVELPDNSDLGEAIIEALTAAAADGFVPAGDFGESMLLIEFPVNGFGTQQDLEKRHALEARMNETLGWTGLGNCDGGSSGSGTMEVCCIVADFAIAKRVIETDLAGTEFGDYKRIYQEDLEME
jgi:hypothetical protein